MASIDRRVVSLEFDNSKFMSRIAPTLQSLQKLKDGLNIGKAALGLQNIASKFSLSGVGEAIQGVIGKFGVLGVAGITALTNITNKAVDAGIALGKSLTIDPIMDGFREYETKLNSVQTILANTAHKGGNIKDVTKTLGDLNTYADKTIYNFAEMTRNIGMFTAAGVDLKTSANSIKGIANLAAMSGSNSQQASTAMYQLSQAISTGTVKLMDWNSVVNAGMGGEVFQKALITTAKAHGKNVDAIIKKNGSFRESLKEGWLTSKVLTQTLTAMTGDYNEQQLRSMGYSAKQAKQMVALGKQGLEAATKVKTATQLIDTLKESVGSGWATTFEYIFGNFEEAGNTFTKIYEKINGVIEGASNARNELLKGWKELGGRDDLVNALFNVMDAVGQLLRPIQQAFRTLIPPMTPQVLKGITEAIEVFTEKLKIGENASRHLGTILSALMVPFSLIIQFATAVGRVLFDLFKLIPKGDGSILGMVASLAQWIVKLNEAAKSSDFFYKAIRTVVGAVFLLATNASKLLTPALQFMQRQFDRLAPVVVRVSKDLLGSARSGWGVLTRNLTSAATSVKNFGLAVSKWLGNYVPRLLATTVEKIKSIGKAIGETIGGIFSGGVSGGKNALASIGKFFAGIGDAIRDGVNFVGKVFKGMGINSIEDLIGNVFAAGSGVITYQLVQTFRKLADGFAGFGDIAEKIGGVFDALSEHIKAMTVDLKAGAILKIAAALGILAASMWVIASIDRNNLAASLGVVTALMAQLFGGSGVLAKFTAGGNVAKMLAAAASMIVLGTALLVFASAVKILSTMNWEELIRGLIGFTVIMTGMLAAVKMLGAAQGDILKGSLGLVALGAGLLLMAASVKILGGTPWDQLSKGLASFLVIIMALTKFISSSGIEKTAFTQGAALAALGVGILLLAGSVKILGDMDTNKVIQGVAAVSVLITALGLFAKMAGGDKLGMQAALGLIGMASAIKTIADIVQRFGEMDLGTLAKGLISVSASMLLVVTTVNAMGGTPAQLLAKGAALAVIAVALNVVGDAVKKLGQMSVGEIVKGLIALGGAMAILVIGLNAMTGALAGAAALVVVALALGMLVPALIALGGMSIGEIVVALIALGGAIVVIGGAVMLIAPATTVLLAFGAALFLIGAAMLAAGGGMALLTAGLVTLASLGTAGLAVITAAVLAFAQTLPMLFRKIGQALIALIGELAKGMPTIMEFFKQLLVGLINLAIQLLPKIAELFNKLLDAILGIIVRNVPRIADAGLKLIIALLQAISSKIGDIVKEAVKLVSEFIRAIGREAPKLVEAGVDMVIDLLNGIAKTIEDKSQALADAAWRIGEAIVKGMLKGLATGPSRIAEKVGNMAQNALDKAKEKLGIRSPSREFYKVGSFVVEGFVNAIDDGRSEVGKSATRMASNALSQFRGIMDDLDMGTPNVDPAADILKRFNDIVSQIDTSDMDLDPQIEITPTLNLDPARAQAKEFLSMFQDPTVTPGPENFGLQARALAALAAESEARKSEPAVQEPPVVNNTYNFEQTNNSPKELTTAELYRQTRNLLSLAKSKG